ncbi:MAG: histidinol-phosphate transaminase [Candidatus Bathyarchaeota archaeon]|nr:histidinol-phosphate transaminase [Candidatus Bathyarchaeota archaeon]
MKAKKLARKEIHGFPSYDAESIFPERLDEKVVKLDLNENFAVSSDMVEKLLLDACQGVDARRYPPPHGATAVEAISNFFGFDESEVFTGNGSDELLDLLMKTFVRKQTRVLVVEPTFPLYTYFTQLYGGEKVTVLLKPDFRLDVNAVLEKSGGEPSLLIVCSPNNPTGNQFAKGHLERVVREFNGLVVVDEAYVDFAKYSVIDWIRDADNLIVLRTFSKAFGLAGIRLGFAVSNRSVIECIKQVTPPFNVNIIAQRLVALALQNWDYFKQQIEYIIREREWLTNALAKTGGVVPYPSDASFVLLRITKKGLSSSVVREQLRSKNVLVKDKGKAPLLENCIRVTVGTRDMNEAFVSALKEVLEE